MKFPIVNDETPDHLLGINATQEGRGLELPPPEYRNYGGIGKPFPREMLIPRGEWQARIQEREERKARTFDVVTAAGLQVKHQGRTPFCWGNSPVWTLQAGRIMAGMPHVELSPASVCCPVTGFRSRGGWGRDALQQIVDYGAVPTSLWPDNAIDRQYYTEQAKREALKYRFDEWWILDSRDHDQVVSCLLRGIPVSAGLNWWQHQVSYTDAVWIDGEACILFANSHGRDYGTNGWATLQGYRMYADDAVAPASVIAA